MKNNQLEEEPIEEKPEQPDDDDGCQPSLPPLSEEKNRRARDHAHARDYPKLTPLEAYWPGQGETWPRPLVERAALEGIALTLGDSWHNPEGYVNNLDDSHLWLLVEWLHFIERGGGLIDEARNPVGVIRSHIDKDARPGVGGCGLPRRDTDAIRARLRRLAARCGDDVPYD